MVNDEEKISSPVEPNAENSVAHPIFSPQETHDIVKSFILGWMRGDLTINFPTGEWIISNWEYLGFQNEPSKAAATQQEVDAKMRFNKFIRIVMGAEMATNEQYDAAISELLEKIMSFKSTGRIEGKFYTYDLERKMLELEEKVDSTDNLVRQLMNLIRSGTTP